MTIAHANPPSRSSATAVLSWGLINIPISLYTATEETRVPRSEFIRAASGELHKVGRRQYDTITGVDVSRDDIVKCATATDGSLVELTDEELAAVTLDSDGTAPIVALIGIEELLANYRVEKHYQARPAAAKKGGAGAEQAFTLLTAALAKRRQAAILRISVRNGVARYAALLPSGALEMLYFTDAVRAERPMPVTEVGERELEMANNLLDAIGSEAPEMLDENAARIQAYVDAKAAGGSVVSTPEVETTAVGTSLEDLLAASIKAAS